jgi:hypothetical protein
MVEKRDGGFQAGLLLGQYQMIHGSRTFPPRKI